MKAHLFGFACLILWELSTPSQGTHHSNPSQNLTALHKDQHSDNKTSNSEPSAFKNITLRKTATSLKKPQIPRSNAPVVRNALASSVNTPALKTGASTPAHVTEPETQVQATGRAILVQSLHDGVKHVVQGSADGKNPVIVINSERSTDKGSLDPFSQDCLDAHNNYRAKHGVPPLMWSQDLAEGAQAWADQLASTDSLQHDQVAVQNHRMGENLAYFQPAVPKCEGAMVDNCVNCREMVQRWYDEVKNYDFDKGVPKKSNAPYKHFSQLIWANTAELGVGTAVSKRYGFITVARYRPSGNEGGSEEFTKNVPPEGGPLPSLSPRHDEKMTANADFKPASLTSGSTLVSNLAPTLRATPATSVLPSKKTNKVVPVSIAAQRAKPAVTVPAKNASTAIQAAPKQVGPKMGNRSRARQPITDRAHAKGGFVHTLTANDGTKAQVYLSKNGGHAGIVFRNKIFRVSPDEDSRSVKRTIYVL